MKKNIDVYALGSATSTWNTSEAKYGTTKNRTITGFIQPRAGNSIFKNQAVTKETTHVLYAYMDVTLNKTDRLLFNSTNYQITYIPPKGVSGIDDHQEIGLKVL
jgi:hypothetical protein